MRKLAVFFMLLFSTAFAQIYEYHDPKGNIVYSDRIPPDPHVVNVQSLAQQNIFHPSDQHPVNSARCQSATSGNLDTTTYNIFELSSPTNNQTFHNERVIPVRVNLIPPLSEGYYVQLLFDGIAHKEPQKQTQFFIENPVRGEHTISAQLLDSKRKVTKSTPPVTIFVHYATEGRLTCDDQIR